MGSAIEYPTQVMAAMVFAILARAVWMTEGQCSCDETSETVATLKDDLQLVQSQVSQLVADLHKMRILNAPVPANIKELQDSVKKLQNSSPNVECNMLPGTPKANLCELGKKIQEHESKFRRIQTEVEERVLTKLEEMVAENKRNATAAWKSVQIVVSRVEEIETNLTSFRVNDDSLRQMNDSIATLQDQVRALNTNVVTTVVDEISELKSQLRNKTESLQMHISYLNRRIGESLSLSRVLNHTLENVTGWIDAVSENANNATAAGDLKLETRISELKGTFNAEVEKLKEGMGNTTEIIHQRPWTQGLQQDHTADCPRLNLLATNDHLVLTTDPGGRFSAWNLPNDPFPVGSVVRFFCAPAGTHRLVGEHMLACLRGKRWSSPLPTCKPVETPPHRSREALPYITHDGLVDEEWISSDDDGRLVVRPGSRLRMECLYPFKEGITVWWRQDDVSPRDATFTLTRKFLFGRTMIALLMDIGTARPYHSGTYSCQTTDGKRHSLSIKIAEVHCDKPNVPLNGEVEVASSGPISVGEKAKFLCTMGYNLSGTEELICLGSGRWSGQPPTCKEMDVTFKRP